MLHVGSTLPDDVRAPYFTRPVLYGPSILRPSMHCLVFSSLAFSLGGCLAPLPPPCKVVAKTLLYMLHAKMSTVPDLTSDGGWWRVPAEDAMPELDTTSEAGPRRSRAAKSS